MRANVRVVAAAAVFSSATFAAQAQQAVEWKVSDGGNGHWYQPTSQLFAHFRDASEWAVARGAHLVTLTNAEENAFVASLASGDFILGGYQDTTAAAYSEPSGGWRWVTDEPWSFTSWMTGEPQNGGLPDLRGEHYLAWWRYQMPTNARWNDIGYDETNPSTNQPWNLRAILEWSADCNNDGIVDYGQILSGQLVDANNNGVPDTCELGPCAGDVIPDGVINGVDLAAVLSAWGTTGQGQFPADANRDGIVNGTDLSYVLSGWGTCVTVPTWATLLEAAPDPALVTSPTLRAAIAATGRPWRVRDTVTQIEFVLIPPGTFNMGCTASNAWGCDPDENPVHAVTLTQPFYLGRYEVTQSQWTARMGSNPSSFQSGPDAPQRPVENVSWNAIQTFLSQTDMRLPTEAEWEYAYRAGTTTAFHGFTGYPDGTNVDALSLNIAWMSTNSGGQTRPVGQKLPNGFGAYDLGGNVAEWLADWYSTTYYASSPSVDPQGPSAGTVRVVRGGAWNVDTFANRAADRNQAPPALTSNVYGFRVARNP